MNPIKWFLRQMDPEKYGTDEEKEQIKAAKYEARYGVLNDKLKCDYCDTVGMVRFRQVQAKKGFSTGKATAAVVTGGMSILATGLAKKGTITKFYCENCKMEWQEDCG